MEQENIKVNFDIVNDEESGKMLTKIMVPTRIPLRNIPKMLLLIIFKPNRIKERFIIAYVKHVGTIYFCKHSGVNRGS